MDMQMPVRWMHEQATRLLRADPRWRLACGMTPRHAGRPRSAASPLAWMTMAADCAVATVAHLAVDLPAPGPPDDGGGGCRYPTGNWQRRPRRRLRWRCPSLLVMRHTRLHRPPLYADMLHRFFSPRLRDFCQVAFTAAWLLVVA